MIALLYFWLLVAILGGLVFGAVAARGGDHA